MNHYSELNHYRKEHMKLSCNDHFQLNQFHDEMIKQIVKVAIHNITSEYGPLPARFSFFVMGSAGRFEQSIWSDQDHGIIHDGTNDNNRYFLMLGKEISYGLSICGYKLCDGNVMASNSLWCKAMLDWEIQIINWLKEADWKSLRYFLTFVDSRVLVGDKSFLIKLKELAFSMISDSPKLFDRFMENVSFQKKGIGFFGQLLPEVKGEDTGKINIKHTIFFSYVNSLRLLSLKERILSSSTISRFEELPPNYQKIKAYLPDFLNLLQFRLNINSHVQSYKEIHFVKVDSLPKHERLELKNLMKTGYNLFSETKEIITKGCRS